MMAVRALDHPACALGEGASYDPRSNTAYWFDITGRALHSYRLAEAVHAVEPLPFTASMLAGVDAQRQVLFTETGLVVRDFGQGGFTPLCPIEADNPATRSNDARVHPSGAMWLGTMGWNAETGVGTIWHYRQGRLARLFDDITITNAICFSPEGDLGYFADTAKATIYRVALDRATGLPRGRPEIWRSGFEGGPDGAVIDSEGHMWVAVWGSGCVLRLDPAGQEVARLRLPASQPACPAFVGPKADKLLIATATYGLEAPAAGDGLCYLADLEVAGLHAPDLLI